GGVSGERSESQGGERRRRRVGHDEERGEAGGARVRDGRGLAQAVAVRQGLKRRVVETGGQAQRGDLRGLEPRQDIQRGGPGLDVRGEVWRGEGGGGPAHQKTPWTWN